MRHLFPLYYVNALCIQSVQAGLRCPASPTFFALSSEKIFSQNVHLLTLICLIVISSFALEAKPYFDFNENARLAYDKVINLRLTEAAQILEELKIEEPDNYIVYYIENYIDFFRVFIHENKAEFDRLETRKDIRLDKIKQADSDSPWFLYTQAEINLQWALARLKFEQYFNAFIEVKSAYKSLNKNMEQFPDFVASQKSLGILHALVGTIPDNYKWGVKILSGMEGSIEKGQEEIESILAYAQKHDFIFEEETQVMYAFVLLHLNNQSEAAWSTIQSGALNSKSNPLACFVLANVAMRTGRTDEAIKMLRNRPKSKVYLSFPYLDYMLGLAKLYRQDKDAARYFKTYLHNFRGVNYIKEAYQKLAWDALLKGDETTYFHYISLAKTEGNAVIGGDKNALKEARSKVVPHPHLLRARLLFDGGYYQKAYDFLLEASICDFNQKRYTLEYTYRLGRISHMLNKKEEALEYYQQTVYEGRYEPYYFACNAALQMGLLYENLKQGEHARKCFELCQKIKPEEYRNSLHQKAKAGLNRLRG